LKGSIARKEEKDRLDILSILLNVDVDFKKYRQNHKRIQIRLL